MDEIIALDCSLPVTVTIEDGISGYKITVPKVTVEKISAWEPAPKPTEPTVPWSKDISGELARNRNCPGLLKNGWWRRELSQIDGLTFHHTLSNSPHATAAYYVEKGGGRPSIPYTIWVTETGEVLFCLALEEGCWHDHTGHKNLHLSVGLAGKLHLHHPSEAQLDAAARVAVWVVRDKRMEIEPTTVKGHRDYTATICPGWSSKRSGNWKAELMNRIEAGLGA